EPDIRSTRIRILPTTRLPLNLPHLIVPTHTRSRLNQMGSSNRGIHVITGKSPRTARLIQLVHRGRNHNTTLNSDRRQILIHNIAINVRMLNHIIRKHTNLVSVLQQPARKHQYVVLHTSGSNDLTARYERAGIIECAHAPLAAGRPCNTSMSSAVTTKAPGSSPEYVTDAVTGPVASDNDLTPSGLRKWRITTRATTRFTRESGISASNRSTNSGTRMMS